LKQCPQRDFVQVSTKKLRPYRFHQHEPFLSSQLVLASGVVGDAIEGDAL